MASASTETIDKESESGGRSAKAMEILSQAVAGVFVTVVAPILLACGLKFSEHVADLKTEPSKPAVESKAAETPAQLSTKDAKDSQPEEKKSSGESDGEQITGKSLSARSEMPAPTAFSLTEASGGKIPRVVKPNTTAVRLFNGSDLTGLHAHVGKHKDPSQGDTVKRDAVFEVQGGLIHVSGKRLGMLATEKEYDNYYLILEYRWGGKSWAPYDGKARRSGLMLHCTGAEGDVDGLWMQSVRCRITEGRTGDLVLYRPDPVHPISLTVEAEEQLFGKDKDAHMAYFYKPGEPLTTLSTGCVCRFPVDRNWQDLSGYRSREEVEELLGGWNVLECVCRQGDILIALNGKTVNMARGCSVEQGKIALQSFGSELFVRKFELRPLADASGVVPGLH